MSIVDRSEIQKLHSAAMELAAQADDLRAGGSAEAAEALLVQAYEQESLAARTFCEDYGEEPTRSVLLRSAASLAIECRLWREAERLASQALAGDPPAGLANELRDLFEQVNLSRHFERSDFELSDTDIQMTLTGATVGFGLIPVAEYMPRAQSLETLLIRNVERQRGLPFRKFGRPSLDAIAGAELYMAAPMAACFSVTWKYGAPRRQKQMFDVDPSRAVADFIECMEFFQRGDKRKLRRRLTDRVYFDNFIQHARRLAPDGNRIKHVGFAALVDSRIERVRVDAEARTRWQQKLGEGEERLEIVGDLRSATKGSGRYTIGINASDGRHVIHVPKSMMNDIVKPLWDTCVKIVARVDKNGKKCLVEIEPVISS